MNIPFPSRISALALFFALPWIATTAAAQVQMLDRPYRSAVKPAQAPSIPPQFDLPVDAMPSVRPALPVAVPVPVPFVAAPPIAVIPSWEIQLADGSLSKALMRWSRVGGLPLLCEATKDLPAVNAKYQGEYIDVLEQVMRDSARSQYPLHACAYDNVVRVLHVSQSCLR